MEEHTKNINDTKQLWSVTGGRTTNTQLQTALTGVTSALDSLKQNQNNGGSLQQLLPVMLAAKWIQNR